MLKEDFTPAHVDRRLFTLAPIVILVAAFAAFAVIPFGSVLPTNFGVEGIEEPIRLVVAPGMNVGVLYVFAVVGHCGVRRDPGGLGQQQQVQLPGWAAIECAADRL